MRIWVARPEPGAGRTAGRVAALGHEAIVAPVLTLRWMDPSPPPLPFAAVLVTSANAVPALDTINASPTLPVLAVGSRTAEVARRVWGGLVLDAEGDAAALSRLVQTTIPPGTALLHLAGAERKREPAASLEAAGYEVVTCVAYVTEPVPILPAQVAKALGADGGELGLDAVLHFSRRSAMVAVDLAVAAGLGGAFAALRHYCLSADVAVPLVAAAIEVHFTPARPSEEALLAGLAAEA